MSRIGEYVAAVAAVLGMGVPTGAARAQLTSAPLVHEPFDYAAGPSIVGTSATGTNLAGAYASDVSAAFQPVVASPGFTYGSLSGTPAAAGNRLSQNVAIPATATVDVDADVLTGPGVGVYFSALFRFDDSTASGGGNQHAYLSLIDADTGEGVTFGQTRIGQRSIRVSADTVFTAGEIADGEEGAFTDGQTLLLIGRYANNPLPGQDRLDLVVYDTADAIAVPAEFDPSDPNAQLALAVSGLDSNLAKISRLGFTLRTGGSNGIDELRIGPTFTVVPEPATSGAAAAFVAAVLGVASRRRRRPPVHSRP